MASTFAKPPMPKPDYIARDVSNETAGFLGRAQLRLKETMRMSKPTVAKMQYPPARPGEEAVGDVFQRGSILGEVEILTGADWSQDIYATVSFR